MSYYIWSIPRCVCPDRLRWFEEVYMQCFINLSRPILDNAIKHKFSWWLIRFDAYFSLDTKWGLIFVKRPDTQPPSFISNNITLNEYLKRMCASGARNKKLSNWSFDWFVRLNARKEQCNQLKKTKRIQNRTTNCNEAFFLRDIS